MPISQAQQQQVWALPEAQLSDGAKAVWQAMADIDQTYNSDTAATVISGQMGGSLSPTEVTTALQELGEKGFLQYTSFMAVYPASLPPVGGV